jgi:hypothetical protein
LFLSCLKISKKKLNKKKEKKRLVHVFLLAQALKKIYSKEEEKKLKLILF